MIFLKMSMYEMVSKCLWSGMNVCVSMELIFPADTQGLIRDNCFLKVKGTK